DMVLSPGKLTLQGLAARSGNGKLAASGDLALAGLRPTSVDAKLDANDFALSWGGSIAAALDGVIRVHGQDSGRGLAGRIAVEQGTLHLPPLASGKKLQPVGPLAEVVFVDAAAKRQSRKQLVAGRAAMPL